MTAHAREIGMPKAIFTNSTGLPDPMIPTAAKSPCASW